MKLKKIEFTPTHAKKGGPPALRVAKGGVFSFNKSLMEHLKLKAGSGVDFFQDEEEKKDWYIRLDPNSKNKVRAKKDAPGVIFNNAQLAQHFLESAEVNEESYSFPVCKEPTKVGKELYYAVITVLKD